MIRKSILLICLIFVLILSGCTNIGSDKSEQNETDYANSHETEKDRPIMRDKIIKISKMNREMKLKLGKIVLSGMI